MAVGASGGLERADPADQGAGNDDRRPCAGRHGNREPNGAHVHRTAKGDGNEGNNGGANDGAGGRDDRVLESEPPYQALQVTLNRRLRRVACERAAVRRSWVNYG